ncbi:MAG: alcohol dehydrogenase catalytic domain-containing protein [Egibacteraceae bacterium]
MLRAVLTELDDLRLEEVETPSAGPGEVLMKVGANTLCPTDVRIMTGAKTSHVKMPVVLGHEVAGHVTEVGEGVEGYEPDTPVALSPVIPCGHCWACMSDVENVCANMRIVGYEVDGGLAEYLLVPAASVAAGCLFVADADLPSEALAVAEPLSCVITGQRVAPIRPGEVVLIMGAGPIGLLHLQMSLLSGARKVIVSQPSEARRKIAERFGAAVTVDPTSEDLAVVVADETGGAGVDSAIICTGAPELVDTAIGLCRVNGRVNIFAGLSDGGRARIDANAIHYRQLAVTGSSNTRRRDYRTALELITSGKIDTASMVTKRYDLSDVDQAIEAVIAREALKVAVLP